MSWRRDCGRAGVAIAVLSALSAGGGRAARAAERPFYYDHALTAADLAGRSLRELTIMRNTIFARAGQPFRKRWLHEYFSTQPWYKSKGVVDPQSLPAVDQQNADLLSRHEIALPRADLEARLATILDRHRYTTAFAGRQVVAFSADGREVLLGHSSTVTRIDLASGKSTLTWQDSFDPNDDTGALGFVAEKPATVILNSHRLETAELGRGTRRVLSTLDLSQAEGTLSAAGGQAINWSRRGVVSRDGRRLLVGPSFFSYDEDENGDGGGPIVDQQDLIAVDIPSAKIIFRQPVEDEHPCYAFLPDGQRAIVSSAGKVALWDLAAQKIIWKIARRGKPEAARCTGVAVSPDGRLAVKAAPAGAQILDMASGQIVQTLALPFGGALAFSPDGRQLLAGGRPAGDQASLELWDVRSGARVRALPARGEIRAVAWSPDGTRAASDGERGPVLWDVKEGRAIPRAFAGHEPWWNRDEQIEAVLLSRALGRKLEQFAALDFERTPFDAPELLDELVPLAQLKEMSRRDLRLLRNMVYARRGRPFHSPLLREYFAKLDWYKVDPAYSDARLKPVDRRNIKLIQSAENEAGGPLNDRQQRQEEEVPEA